MSVSFALVPVVLILRVAMGKDEFDKWVESSQKKMPTIFKDEKELIITLKKAGYDSNKYGSLIKTHLNDKKQFFFWEKINGTWNAVFSKYDSEGMINDFIYNLEKYAGKKLIVNSLEEVNGLSKPSGEKSEIPALKKINKETFPTNFVDKEILVNTLKEYSVNVIEQINGDIRCYIEKYTLTFHKEESGNYDLEVRGTESLKPIYEQLVMIDEEYRKNVQVYTYEKVVKKLKQSSMYVESEETMEDNSIVLTINIGE